MVRLILVNIKRIPAKSLHSGTINEESESHIDGASDENHQIYYNQFMLKIIDTGQGISDEGLKTLFADFNSLSEHKKTNQRGTGLGLSICKKIIQKMGGDVTVESTVGVGTTFTIHLTVRCKLPIIDLSNSLNSSFVLGQSISQSSVNISNMGV
jgi:two-component system capsular synthesis sensor histidine kinase RcsC